MTASLFQIMKQRVGELVASASRGGGGGAGAPALDAASVNPPLAELSVASESRKIVALAVVVDRVVTHTSEEDALVLVHDEHSSHLTCCMHADIVTVSPQCLQRGTGLVLRDVSLVVVGPRCAFLGVSSQNVYTIFVPNHERDAAARDAVSSPPPPPVQGRGFPSVADHHHQFQHGAGPDDVLAHGDGGVDRMLGGDTVAPARHHYAKPAAFVAGARSGENSGGAGGPSTNAVQRLAASRWNAGAGAAAAAAGGAARLRADSAANAVAVVAPAGDLLQVDDDYFD